jgi:hypothetical protein
MADNVQIVLNAFEALFSKRDYAAAELPWYRAAPSSLRPAPSRNGYA